MSPAAPEKEVPGPAPPSPAGSLPPIKLVIPGAPRTKKTSNQIVGIGPRCSVCGKSRYQNVQPSEAFREWFATALTYAPYLRNSLLDAGIELPMWEPVSVAALFYRDRAIGDPVGYYQALADWLQAPREFRSRKTGRITQRRNGAGIIEDDRQIQHWDGSRLLIDRESPRIELVIYRLAEHQQGTLWPKRTSA
jgi:hypothetical protein